MSHKKSIKENEQVFWVSYSDLSTALMLCFILVFLMAISKLQRQKDELDHIMKRRAQMVSLSEQVIAARQRVIQALENVQGKLGPNFIELNCKGVKNFVVNGNRLSLIAQFESSHVEWFERNSAEMKPKAKNCIKHVAPVWLGELYSMQHSQTFIQQLVIEGHANKENRNDTFLYNLGLSQCRSYNVASFILQNKESVHFRGCSTGQNAEDRGITKTDYKDYPIIQNSYKSFNLWLKKTLSATGRSFAIPYTPGANLKDKRNRRVEFRVVINAKLDELSRIAPQE
jgi:outer membrane protein OmpA-like peptidoglycan-associated protein